MEKQLLSMADVVRKTKIPRHRICYLLETNKIKEPPRLNGRRCFGPKDIEEISRLLKKRSRP